MLSHLVNRLSDYHILLILLLFVVLFCFLLVRHFPEVSHSEIIIIRLNLFPSLVVLIIFGLAIAVPPTIESHKTISRPIFSLS
ncbi:hypothetical protein V8C43DRAFT_278752 [Trichoderma afarasin]